MWLDFSPESSLENSLLVRCAFWKNFRERSFVFCLCVQLVFFDVVLPMFLLYYLALFSQKLPEEIFSFRGAHSAENFRERSLVFGLCVWLVFFLAFFASVSSLLCRIVEFEGGNAVRFYIFFCSETFRFFPKFAPKIFFVAIVGQKVLSANFVSGSVAVGSCFSGKRCPFLYHVFLSGVFPISFRKVRPEDILSAHCCRHGARVV